MWTKKKTHRNDECLELNYCFIQTSHSLLFVFFSPAYSLRNPVFFIHSFGSRLALTLACILESRFFIRRTSHRIWNGMSGRCCHNLGFPIIFCFCFVFGLRWKQIVLTAECWVLRFRFIYFHFKYRWSMDVIRSSILFADYILSKSKQLYDVDFFLLLLPHCVRSCGLRTYVIHFEGELTGRIWENGWTQFGKTKCAIVT